MNNFKLMLSAKSAKAFVAGLAAAITAAIVASADGFTSTELLTIFGALVVTFQAAFWVPNAEAPADGNIDVTQVPDGTKVFSLNLESDPADLDLKDKVIFTINK
jgi:hypothetical protein